MSREVRRVPLDWEHPKRPDPYPRIARSYAPPSRLLGPGERFIPLYDDHPRALANWEGRGEDLRARTGTSWEWSLKHYVTGCVCEPRTGPWDPPIENQHHHDEPRVHDFWQTVGDEEVPVYVRNEDHLFDLMWEEHLSAKPDPEEYMPVFGVPEEDLGWCLYETVSEGTPVTAVFPTAEALIDHLVKFGQDWDQVPMRRAAAEILVRSGSSIGSLVAIRSGNGSAC